jgi:hypothetical protein
MPPARSAKRALTRELQRLPLSSMRYRRPGITSLKGIAKALSERGVPTPWGGHQWQAVQVSRVLVRLAE